jgi:hypothetical protein
MGAAYSKRTNILFNCILLDVKERGVLLGCDKAIVIRINFLEYIGQEGGVQCCWCGSREQRLPALLNGLVGRWYGGRWSCWLSKIILRELCRVWVWNLLAGRYWRRPWLVSALSNQRTFMPLFMSLRIVAYYIAVGASVVISNTIVAVESCFMGRDLFTAAIASEKRHGK